METSDRIVTVGQSDAMWFTWNDRGEIEWFRTRTAALEAARSWAFRFRPARVEISLAGEVQTLYGYGREDAATPAPAGKPRAN